MKKSQAKMLDQRLLHRRGTEVKIANLHRLEYKLITDVTSCGKTYLAGALENAACEKGYTVAYYRLAKLLAQMEAALMRPVMFHSKFLSQFRKLDLLVLDDWGIGRIKDSLRPCLLEMIDEIHENTSILIVSILSLKNRVLEDARN